MPLKTMKTGIIVIGSVILYLFIHILSANLYYANISSRFRPACRMTMVRNIHQLCNIANIEACSQLSRDIIYEDYLFQKYKSDAKMPTELRHCKIQKLRRSTQCEVPYYMNELLEYIKARIEKTPWYDMNLPCPGEDETTIEYTA